MFLYVLGEKYIVIVRQNVIKINSIGDKFMGTYSFIFISLYFW